MPSFSIFRITVLQNFWENSPLFTTKAQPFLPETFPQVAKTSGNKAGTFFPENGVAGTTTAIYS